MLRILYKTQVVSFLKYVAEDCEQDPKFWITFISTISPTPLVKDDAKKSSIKTEMTR